MITYKAKAVVFKSRKQNDFSKKTKNFSENPQNRVTELLFITFLQYFKAKSNHSITTTFI